MTQILSSGQDRNSLRNRTEAWVGADIISPSQAEAIIEHEAGLEVESQGRLSLGAEVAAYLGSVLALTGGTLLLGGSWSDMTFAGRFGIAVALSAVGLLTGTWLMRAGEKGTSRLGSFLWFIGTGGIALAVAVGVDDLDIDPTGWNFVVIGGTVVLVGIALWRNRDLPLQLLAVVLGTAAVVGGLADLTEVRDGVFGAVVLAAGLTAGALARAGWIRPLTSAMPGSAIIAMIGGSMFNDYNGHLATSIVAATSALVVLVALADKATPTLVVGVIGFLISIQILLNRLFDGVLASVVVTAIGLAVVVVAVVRSMRKRSPV